MRIAIVDDSSTDSLLLLKLLNIYMEQYDFSPEFFSFSSGEEFLDTVERDVYDLCFLDIFMEKMNGIEVADKLRTIDPNCFVIFLTGSPDFFADGFRLRAWRYLLKPITMEQLMEALPECIEHIQLSTRRLSVSIGRQEISIPFSKICYVITSNRNIEIHGNDAIVTTGKQFTFQELTGPLLNDYRFLIIGKGLVTNLSYVNKIEGNSLIMQNGENLPISRSRLSEVSEAFIRFRFETQPLHY